MDLRPKILERFPLLQKAVNPLHRFVALTMSLFFVFVLLRIYEFLLIGNEHAMPENSLRLFVQAIGYDVILLLKFSGILLIPYLLLSLKHQRAGTMFYGSAALIFLVLDIALLQYFFVTFVPLGADLFGYSLHDIQLTVSSSGGFSLMTIVPFVVGIGFVWAALVFSARITLPRFASGVYLAAVILACIFADGLTPNPARFKHESEHSLASNKVGFFVEKTWTYLTSSRRGVPWTPAQEYPLLHDVSYEDVLGPFFTEGKVKPNLVFIIAEGLGRSFVGEGAPLGGFTPFLDSLTQESLYWENFLSTSGRTFAVLPSLFGSLPFGEKGFMELGNKMPAHLSLIKILEEQGYYTSYYYGGNANFDLQDVFLERQKLDFLLDEYQFGADYRKQDPDAGGFSWGYADGDLFKRSLEVINEKKKDPRLDIYMTMSTHEPFLPPNKEHYLREFDDRLSRLSVSPGKLDLYRKYRQEFSSLLYLDDAVRYLIGEYSNRPENDHTIFIITGDHRIIPIPTETRIDRFHVPLILYSKMLKRPQRFSSVSTHADVTPSLLAFLENNYGLKAPGKAHWLGNGIDTAIGFRNIHSQPLMRTKEDLVDYLDKDYFLAAHQLFKLLPGLDLEESQDHEARLALEKQLDDFRQLNAYVCSRDKIFPELPGETRVSANTRDDSAYAMLNLHGLNSDQLFQLAREKASTQNYEEVRTICRKLLRNGPNYHDVRTLLGRTFAWEKRYDEARPCFVEVIRRAPNYPDAQTALVDVEFWSGNTAHALTLVNQALQRFPTNQDLLIRKSKLLAALGKRQESLDALEHLLKVNPSSVDGLALQKQLSK